jgi:hypothetical protein
MSASARTAAISSTRGSRGTTGASRGFVPTPVLVAKSNASGVIVAARLTGCSTLADDDLGNDIAAVDNSSSAFFLVVNVVVAMIMGVIAVGMIVIVVSVGMSAVAVATEHEETNQVGEEASRTDNEHELGVFNRGGFDESSQGLEDNGDAEGDKEDGIEEGTEDFGSYPLVIVSMRKATVEVGGVVGILQR